MPLSGIRTLIDGRNLELAEGTGIKTYSSTLITALSNLGMNLGVLFGRNVPSSKNPCLNAALFFDEVRAKRRSRTKVKHYLRAYLSTCGVAWRADRVTRPEYVFAGPVEELAARVSFYNAQNCFRLAEKVARTTKRPLQVSVPDEIDVYHMTCPMALRVRAAHTIATVHDLVPLKLPYTTLDRTPVFYRTVAQTLRNFDLIVTISNASRHDILETFDLDPDKVVCTYQTCAPIFTSAVAAEQVEATLRQYELKRDGFVLFVGAIEPKKNVRRLIQAYQRLDTDAPLVIVGPKAWLSDEQLEPLQTQTRGQKKIRLLGHIPDDQLRDLYHGARCFAFPSLYEGFGLPVLEAMSCGCPVLTSNSSSLPEVAGRGALYAEPFDVRDISGKLDLLLSDDALCRRLSNEGRKQAAKFSQDAYQTRLEAAYRKLLGITGQAGLSSYEAAA